jgi:N-acetylglucosaminyl-diphospho-decaprenol L-rhamnosyltransferase
VTNGRSKPSTARLEDFEVVLVTYHSRDLVAELFRSLPHDVGVVVVDNSNGVDAVQDLLDDRSNARYLEGGGIGFARAANLGARTSSRPYLVFVNPDARPTVTQMLALVDELIGDARLGAAGATTVTTSGEVELGVGGWEPTVLRCLVYASTLHSRFPTRGLYARPEPYSEVELDWLTGACLAVPRKRFLALGGFDETFFVYNEDMAYGRRVREAGLRQRLRTDILVPHAGAGSGASTRIMLQMRGASMMNYVGRHNSTVAAQAMRLVLSAGALGRALVCGLRSRRSDAVGFIAYSRGLWQGPPRMS